jgi:PAS domain S-box-containing protein
MFGAFILGCGTTHAMEVWTVWHGTYRLAGFIKFLTAALSVTTAVALVPLMPKALALPSPEKLAAANRELELEVRNRQRAEEEVRHLNESLERRVVDRTAELEASNRELRHEIAERHRAEDRFKLAVESAPNAMVMADHAGSIVMANAQTEKLFGYSREELIGMPVVRLSPGLGEQHPQAGREVHGVRKDGSEFPIEIGLNPIETDNGTWTLGAIVDISERRRAEEEHRKLEAQIQHAQKLESLGVLAGGIAHDFNNLLVSILGNAGLALMELPPGSPVRPTVKNIEAGALRAADLTRQMLAYSGKGKFLIQAVNLSLLVEEMAHLLEISISKKATFRTRLENNLPSIEADVVQIQQVVMNLITNASESLGDQRGDIVICTGSVEADRDYLSSTFFDENLPEGPYIFLEVTDNGCGMDKETLQRIFDPFFTTKFTGRGLGLAAVMGIVRGHRGAIKVYSEPGKGTSFKVLLPASPRPAQTGRVAEAAAVEPGFGTILVVDDEPGVRQVASRVLQKDGFTVITAPDGRTGVEMFREHAGAIRAVLLDLTMPDLSGEEVFRAIRAIRPDVRVILSSGYNEQETISLFQAKGLAGFIQKPYQPATLSGKVRQVLK